MVHLDVLFWKPGWVESSYEEFRPKVAAAVAEDRWIMDGNYSRTFDIRMPRPSRRWRPMRRRRG